MAAPPGEPRRVAYLYLLPAFAVYAVFLLYPIGRAVQISLYDWDGLSLGTWAGLDNYVAVVADEGLRAAFAHALVLIVFYAAGRWSSGWRWPRYSTTPRCAGWASSAPSCSCRR